MPKDYPEDGYKMAPTSNAPNRGQDNEEKTIEVSLSQFAFWQSQMAHASERAANNPEHNGSAVHQAHHEMYGAIRAFHESTSCDGGRGK